MSTQIEEIEAHIDGLTAHVERQILLKKLEKLPEFKKLILDYYLVENCARLARGGADLALTKDERADCLEMAAAAGHFKQFLSVVHKMGDKAVSEIEQHQELIMQLTAEEATAEVEG